MSEISKPERERVISQALRARTVTEIEVAERQLRQWIQDHPEDLGVRDAFEPLTLRCMALEEIAEPKVTVAK